MKSIFENEAAFDLPKFINEFCNVLVSLFVVKVTENFREVLEKFDNLLVLS